MMLLSGTLADLDLASIAATTSLGRSSLRLELRASSGDLIGSLVLKAGRVVSATAGTTRGRDALRVLMNATSDARFQLAHEPLDFVLSSALASVDELGGLGRGSTRSPRLVRPATSSGAATRSLRNGRPGTAPPPAARVAMMQGRLDEFDLLTLLQTVGVGRQLVELEILDRGGTALGAIRVKSGKVVSAQAGDIAGVEAVSRLLQSAESFAFAAYRVSAELGQIEELASVVEIGIRFAGDVPAPSDQPIMEGSLSEFDLPTVLHTVGCSRQYCALEVRDEQVTRGTIFVKSGIVLAAIAGPLTGIPAVQHLIASYPHGRFRLTQLAAELPDHAPLGPVGQVLLHVDAPAPAAGPPGGVDLDEEPTRASLPGDLVVMEGKLSDFDIRTVLEVLAGTRQHARLQILGPRDRALGEVTLKAGWIISVQAGALRGREALVFLLGASPQLRFRVLTVGDGPEPEETLGAIHEVLASIPVVRAPRSESSTKILRWAIPLSFAVGGAIVLLVTRGATIVRPDVPPSPPVMQREPPPPVEATAPGARARPAPPPSGRPAPAAAPQPPAAPAATAPTPQPAQPQPPAAAAPTPQPAQPPTPQPAEPPQAAEPPQQPATPPAPTAQPPPTAPLAQTEPAAPAGLNIRNAQAAFKQLGYDPGPIDNVYGRLTRNAILRFQRSQHLPATGLLDDATWAALVGQLMPQRARH